MLLPPVPNELSVRLFASAIQALRFRHRPGVIVSHHSRKTVGSAPVQLYGTLIEYKQVMAFLTAHVWLTFEHANARS
jgi:hypothetical protein